MLALGVFAAYWSVYAITQYFADANRDWAALLVPSALAAAAVAWIAAIYATRYRFNDKGVEHRFLHRSHFVRWADIAEINSSLDMFAWITLKSGKSYTIAKGLRGFVQMIATAQRCGVKIKK